MLLSHFQIIYYGLINLTIMEVNYVNHVKSTFWYVQNGISLPFQMNSTEILPGSKFSTIKVRENGYFIKFIYVLLSICYRYGSSRNTFLEICMYECYNSRCAVWNLRNLIWIIVVQINKLKNFCWCILERHLQDAYYSSDFSHLICLPNIQ